MSKLKVPFQEFLEWNKIKVEDLPDPLKRLVVSFGEMIDLHDNAPDLLSRAKLREWIDNTGDKVLNQLEHHFQGEIEFNCNDGDFCPQVVKSELLPLTLWENDEDLVRFLHERNAEYISEEVLRLLGFSGELGGDLVSVGEFELYRPVFWNNYRIRFAEEAG